MLESYDIITLISLVVLAFAAGFIDAVVGGGGLIQIPALLINLPTTPLATLLGTNKIAGLAGTSISALQYSKRIKFDFQILIPMAIVAAISSVVGARLVSYIPINILKPFILILLIVITIYTFLKKDLGSKQSKNLSLQKNLIYGCLISAIVGFYDGFFGPGTGSFFVLGFVLIMGFPFVKASAYSKVINCMTNIGALIIFLKQGNYIIEIAIMMAACNIVGSMVGTSLALKKGNEFIRKIFLVIVMLLIGKYGYDIFIQ